MNRTWFISPLDEQVVLIEHPISNGSNDDQWRTLIRATGIRVANDNRKWGALSRCQLLNWIEANYPDRMPRFFDSKEAALEWLRESKKSNLNEEEIEDPTPDGAA